MQRTTLSNAAMNHDYTLWCAGAVCILHHHLTVSRSYFAILSRTYLITIIHTHTRKISGDQNSNFIFEQHKKRICLGLSLGCGSAAHWSTIHRAFILWVFETDLVYGWVEQMIGCKWYAECIFTWTPTCMTMNQHSGRALVKQCAEICYMCYLGHDIHQKK